MNDPVDLKSMLEVAVGKVDQRKLNQLKQKLEDMLGNPLSSYTVEDPIIIRYRLVEKLRNDGISPGVIHSFEQLFMGIVRRAALAGLIPAPPEGPWTRAWQSVLDGASNVRKAKSLLRTLAGWSTARGLSPSEINTHYLELWATDALVTRECVMIVEQVLAQWQPTAIHTVLLSDSFLSTRLQKKASGGTVKADRSVL